MSKKEEIRIEARKHRARMQIGAAEYDALSSLFFEHINPPAEKVIAGYWPIEREIDPRYIMDEAMEQSIECCLPVVEKDTRELSFHAWNNEAELKKGSFGIMEPAIKAPRDPDILIIPLLAFDRHGTRLGQGCGYYDATLQSLRSKKEIVAVGLAYGEQACLFNLPREEHDEPLDWIITPQQAIKV